MQLLDLTLPLPAENVALDEALLEACEAGEISDGVLRLWEADHYFVVLGRSSDPAVEVNLDACRAQGIAVLRRASGGGTILAGPGCLMYAVVMACPSATEFRSISWAHQFVLNRIAVSLAPLAPGVSIAGTSDLAFRGDGDSPQKFSGNALRMKRTHFLYHGTLLYDFDLDRVSQLLARQTREPVYRASRDHGEFLANLPVSRSQLVTAITTCWQANEKHDSWPQKRMQKIVKKKYIVDPTWVI